MNKVFLIGDLAKDPELSKTPNGLSVCKFGLIVPRKLQGATSEIAVSQNLIVFCLHIEYLLWEALPKWWGFSFCVIAKIDKRVKKVLTTVKNGVTIKSSRGARLIWKS